MVGVGDGDLSKMASVANYSADTPATGVKFWNEGERGARDIVQFVAMKGLVQGDDEDLKRVLAKQVLSKIPPQYLEYMKIRKIPPKPPRNSTLTRDC